MPQLPELTTLMKLIQIARLALFVLSCVPAVLTVGCTMTAREAVQLAQARWHRATEVTAPLPAIRAHWGSFQCGPDVPTAAGCWNSTRQVISLDVRAQDILEQVAVHEWGHRLGAHHGKDDSGIMAERASTAANCITQADIDLVCAVNDCAVERPETCTE